MTEKTLHNSDVSGARVNVPDIGDMFKLLCKASSQNEGWMQNNLYNQRVNIMTEKTLHNSDVSGARVNVPDIEAFRDECAPQPNRVRFS